MRPHMATKNTVLGRKKLIDQVYNLILLASALRESFDALDLDVIQERFAISSKEAYILSELLQLPSENNVSSLPLTFKENILTLVGDSPFKKHRLVLNAEEQHALYEAFISISLPQDSLFWNLLESPYCSLKSSYSIKNGSSLSKNKKSSSAFREVDTFMQCSEAISQNMCLSFTYHSKKHNNLDEMPTDSNLTITKRTIVPRRLLYGENGWLIEGVDLALKKIRVFRLSRMEHISSDVSTFEQQKEASRVTSSSTNSSSLVKLTFLDKSVPVHYTWPGVTILRNNHKSDEIKATIPYYGGTWLPQRLIAHKEFIKTDNKDLIKDVQKYAASMLNLEKQLCEQPPENNSPTNQ